MTSKTTTKKSRKAADETVETAERATDEASKAAREGAEQVREGIEAAAAFNQGNIEAVVTSSKIAAKTMENMTSEIAAYSKKSCEDSMAAAKELSSCRTMAEMIEKQTAFSRTSIETFVSEATKLNEMYAAAAQEAFEPIGQRFTAALDLMKGYRV